MAGTRVFQSNIVLDRDLCPPREGDICGLESQLKFLLESAAKSLRIVEWLVKTTYRNSAVPHVYCVPYITLALLFSCVYYCCWLWNLTMFLICICCDTTHIAGQHCDEDVDECVLNSTMCHTYYRSALRWRHWVRVCWIPLCARHIAGQHCDEDVDECVVNSNMCHTYCRSALCWRHWWVRAKFHYVPHILQVGTAMKTLTSACWIPLCATHIAGRHCAEVSE